MTDESEIQLTLKDGASLILSEARSNLIARGRRDAATLGTSLDADAFLDLLRETMGAWNDCRNRVTTVRLITTEQCREPELQTAAWRAMHSFVEEITPYYEKLISVPNLETTTRNSLANEYIWFLWELSDAMWNCHQYAAAKKLLLEAKAHSGDAEIKISAVDSVWMYWQELEQMEKELGQVFDPDNWEHSMPSADKTARSNDLVRLRLKWPML